MTAETLKPNQLISYEQLLEFLEQRGVLNQPFHYQVSCFTFLYFRLQSSLLFGCSSSTGID
ncbi:hypothetical protein AB8849_08360 [Proteus vulgaris]